LHTNYDPIQGRSWPGVRGSGPPTGPEATRQISANPVRNALLGSGWVVTWVPGESDVCVIGHILLALCVRVRRQFADTWLQNTVQYSSFFNRM